MTSPRIDWGSRGAAAVVALGLLALGLRAVDRAAAASPRAYELAPLPAGIDSMTPLAEVARVVESCSGSCPGIIYLWTPRMPLSRSGIPNVIRAARAVGVQVALASSEELLDYAEGRHAAAAEGLRTADALLEAGVLAHAPAIVVHSRGRPIGTAILGYKSADAYASLLSRRLSDGLRAERPASQGAFARLEAGPTRHPERADFAAVGLPGAYFRWVPGTRLLAYESGRTIYFLDLVDGQNRVAPG